MKREGRAVLGQGAWQSGRRGCRGRWKRPAQAQESEERERIERRVVLKGGAVSDEELSQTSKRVGDGGSGGGSKSRGVTWEWGRSGERRLP